MFSTDVALLNGITLASGTTERNLVVVFDKDMPFNSHIKHISSHDTEGLAYAFVSSRMDYLNSLPSGCPKSS